MSRPARRTIGWHRIFFFTFLPTSRLLPPPPPPGRPPARLLHFSCVSLAARVEIRFPHANQNGKTTTVRLLQASPLLVLWPRALSFFPRTRPPLGRSRDVLPRASVSISLNGVSFEPLATRSPFNVTKDPACGTHITLLSCPPCRSRARNQPTADPSFFAIEMCAS